MPAADSPASGAEASAAVFPAAESEDDFFPQEGRINVNANSIATDNVNLAAAFIFNMVYFVSFIVQALPVSIYGIANSLKAHPIMDYCILLTLLKLSCFRDIVKPSSGEDFPRNV